MSTEFWHPTGDLVFFGAGSTAITHVGIVASPTQMINAPDVGLLVRLDHIGIPKGATRPADTHSLRRAV